MSISTTRRPAALFIVLFLVAVNASWAGAVNAEEKAYAKTRQGRKPVPTVAVENVCAWPNLTVLEDGTIAATIFNQPNHGLAAGDVDVWTSKDQGKTWQKAGTPAPHEPDTNRMNTAAGRAKNGDLIVIASGWSNKYPPGKKGRAFRSGVIDAWISRSDDGGRTWSIDKNAAAHRAPDGCPWIPFGDIVLGDDGVLRAPVYTFAGLKKRRDRVFIIESKDDGKTWGGFVPLDDGNDRNETAMLYLGKGKWLIATRSDRLYCYASDDNGKTWKPRGPVTERSQVPGHLMRLADGRILLTYGDRTGKKHGVEVKSSRDEGKTWSKPMRLVDWWGDGGYPSSVQLPDGQVVTAYYARKVEGHDGYHMGVVIWDPKSLEE